MKHTASEQSSDNFWSESPNTLASPLKLSNKKSSESGNKDLLSSIDEAPDFYDPYSDLNLFLSQKIKQQMHHFGSVKKWSLKIQDELVKKITPEFQCKFPQYRLGISALKKTWEKIIYYSQQIQGQKEAISQDGKLNINFFIKENLKQYICVKTSSHLRPFHYAQQLAMKMSECMATVDGVRPKLDHLTKMIWSVQRHLIQGGTPEQCKSPYDEYDKVDKLIVKSILEITAKEPQIGHKELEHKVKETLHSLHELPTFASIDKITGNVSALLAEKLYTSSSFHTQFFADQKNAIVNFIQRHSSLCKIATPAPQFSELVRRITALYTLATQLPKTLSEEEIKNAVDSTYPVSQLERPNFPQSLYAFIAAELLLMKHKDSYLSLDSIHDSIWAAYKEATLLPELKGKERDILEIVMWKSLSETEGLLEKLPYKIGQRIEEEIANILIDNPEQNFSAIVQAAVQFFNRTKELVLIKKWSDVERKIHTWIIQGDMLCRWIKLDGESSLLKMIQSKYFEMKKSTTIINHQVLVSEICHNYLKEHPELIIYSGQLAQRIWILYKYAWYTLFATAEETSYDRFIKWHICHLMSRSVHISPDYLFQQMEEIVKKTIPLTPFDANQTKELIRSLHQKPAA